MRTVARDREGLAQAAFELMEESFGAPELERNRKLALQTADPEATLARFAKPQRTMTAGYYAWVTGYLAELERTLELGAAISSQQLSDEDLIGLRALEEARRRFREKHPQCRGCGNALANHWDRLCGDCMTAEAEALRVRN